MDVDKVEYWAERWQNGTYAWHRSEPQPSLVTHLPRLTGGREGLRIFVPLCGKTGCLLFLYKGGHTVIGVEGVETVVEQFFTENQLEFDRTEIPEIKGSCYSSKDNKLKIFACDLFLLSPGLVGTVDAVWDRGSLVALSPKSRTKYVDFMKLIVGTTFRQYLLESYDYDPTQWAGPPHSITKEDVRSLYENWADIQVDSLIKNVFLLTPRNM